MNALLCSSDRGSPSAYPISASTDRKSSFNHSNKLKVPPKITASECLVVDTVSATFCIDDLLDTGVAVSGKRERPFNRVTIKHGLLTPEYSSGFTSDSNGGAWLRHLRLASNVHFQNVAVEVAKGRKIRVRVVADVQVGEEIQMWFSPQVLLAMQIPFLTPANIKGQNIYCCHVCAKVFEDPNPLKLHLTRNCDSLPMDILWQRLRSFLPPPNPSPAHQLHPTTSLTPPTTCSTPPTPPTTNRMSAFHPVNHHNHPATNNPFNYADPEHLANSHLETIVSNMGTSKQGHLCIYCGKLYSRKYGLKIHIRTHTGFKPLKCKFCHRPFGDPSNLNKHIRLHLQNQSPTSHGAQSNFYKCHLCAKIMIRKRDLQRHIEMRHFHHQDRDQDEHRSRGGFSADSPSNMSSNSACSSSNEEDEEVDEDVDVDMEDPDD